MKHWKKISMFAFSAFTAFTLMSPSFASADAIIGQTVVTVGKDLTGTQKDAIMQEMQVPSDAKVIEVTNQEEYKYLGKYMSKSTIGTKAISSAKITLEDSGKGISVKTNNISTITPSMYANAAITAGIKDATIYVTAPIKVSGTAGLTGIIKAFETATGKKIDEKQKQVANEEMVRTSEVASQIGDPNKAAQFMNKIKEEVAKQKPTTPQQYKDIIVNVSNQFNINLNQQTINQLVQFSKNFSTLNINWDELSNQLKNQFNSLSGDIKKVVNNKQTQDIFDSILKWLGDLFSSISDFFSKSSTNSN